MGLYMPQVAFGGAIEDEMRVEGACGECGANVGGVPQVDVELSLGDGGDVASVVGEWARCVEVMSAVGWEGQGGERANAGPMGPRAGDSGGPKQAGGLAKGLGGQGRINEPVVMKPAWGVVGQQGGGAGWRHGRGI